jgi:hypothetical protein
MTTSALVPYATDDERQAAIYRAVGLEKVSPEQRELAIAIAERYGLDLMLKHLVMVEGKPFITRDGLLHIAHRSGVFDGIAVTTPEKVDRYWRATATVWRKDMSRPFVYPGRYPAGAKNDEEMGIKVAESMALRRAFDVSAPTLDERWASDDAESAPMPEVPAKASLAERARAVAAAAPEPAPVAEGEYVEVSESAPAPAAAPGASVAGEPVRCDAPSPYEAGSEPCAREAGHKPPHKNHDRETWA